MANVLSKSVVFITGTFIGNNCWDEWKLYFENKGYRCIAPAWPYKNASPQELRNRHPDNAIASNRLNALVDYFKDKVDTLPEPSIVIGHSLGGLIVQLLLQRGVGSAGVAIHSFPPPGTGLFTFSLLNGLWGAMGFFTATQKTYMISFKTWKHTVANGMSCEQQKQSFYKYAVPESKQVTRDTFKHAAKINFKQPHAPLLLVSGSDDRVIPASHNYKNYKKYKRSHSIVVYKEFNGNHLVFEHPAWKENADFILNWLQEIT
jgi:pimeloyl-ACP methyl ester carboxylesterase